MEDIQVPPNLCPFHDECGLYKVEDKSVTCHYGPHNYCGKFKELLWKYFGIF